MFVNVVPNEKAAELNRAFCYSVPESMAERARVGMRVLIRLGKRRTEGVIVSLTDEKPDIKNIRPIDEIPDREPVINETGFALARFIVKKYLASLSDALRLNMPSGIKTFSDEKLIIKENTDIAAFSGVEREILNLLSRYDGVRENELCEALGKKSLKKEIKALTEKGVIETRVTYKSALTDKTATVASLSVSVSEAEDYAAKNPGKKAQARLLKILCDNKSMLLSDLLMFSKATRKTAEALEGAGLIELEEIEVIRNPYLNADYEKDENKTLNPDQQKAFDLINTRCEKGGSEVFLLRGITGSGKTEIYLQLIGEVIKRGKTALVLVPEISLTPQISERFFKRFGKCVAIIHSGLSANERYDQTKLIKSGEIKVVIGARSAVFAPIENTGIIIVDEEHEDSYRSENNPRYDGVEVALERGRIENIPVVLASATPAVSSYYRAVSGEYTLIEINKRYNSVELPEVVTVDMRNELKKGNFSPLSEYLKEELGKRIEKGEQSIFFLNRRGYSTFVSCRNCGYVAKCPNCDVSLTYHSFKNSLVCHHCGYDRKNFDACPECGSKYIRYFGTGTQKIEEEIKKEFPQATVIRMDADTTYKKFAHEKILRRFATENINILLGTQMITKGLDFKNVSLAAVLAADGGLYSDDYRAYERTFSHITQVIGRAGRGESRGLGIIQTYSPENYVITNAARHDYKNFYETEIILRKQMKFPPFYDIIIFTGVSEDMNEARKTAEEAYRVLNSYKSGYNIDREKLRFFAPVEAPIFKVKNKYRYRIFVKAAPELDFIPVAGQIRKRVNALSKGILQIEIEQ